MTMDYDRISEENTGKYGTDVDRYGKVLLSERYSEKTHFIFELLQNAEDARAGNVRFKLAPNALRVFHDGRVFNEDDVIGICGLVEGTKSGALNKIGEFGIGFKSVYAYTESPEVHSGSEHFVIKNYVHPEEKQPLGIEDGKTLFVLPFDSEDISEQVAFEQIQDRLVHLDMRTLLFLRNIQEIEWSTTGESGVFLRDEEKVGDGLRRIYLIGKSGIQEREEEWIVFGRRINTENAQLSRNIEIAFLVQKDEEGTERVVPADDTKMVVFFPTDKDTPFGFLMQGPYRTTPSRDNIPQDDENNKKFVRQTADLLVESMHQIKDMGLLTVDFLETLPLERGDAMFAPIYDRVRGVLREEDLLPAADGSYVAGKNAKLARGEELTELFSNEQLSDLLKSDKNLKWLSTRITDNRPELYRYLVGRKKGNFSSEWDREPLVSGMRLESEDVVRKLTEGFLAKQPDAWLRRLYAYAGERSSLWDILERKPIIRLEDGSHIRPSGAYLPRENDHGSQYPTVKPYLVKNPKALKFLKGLGLTEPSIYDEVKKYIIPKYEEEYKRKQISWSEHLPHMYKILKALQGESEEKRRKLRQRMEEVPFVRAVSWDEKRTEFKKPGKVYLECAELRMYFEENEDAWFLDPVYPPEETANIKKEFGVDAKVRVVSRSADFNGHIKLHDSHGMHARGLNGFDKTATIDGLEFAIATIDEEKAAYIWNKVLVDNEHLIQGTIQRSKRQNFPADHTEEKKGVLSDMGKHLTNKPWLPDRHGRFSKPSEMSLKDLPDDFARNELLAEKLDMQKDVWMEFADEVGIGRKELREIIDLTEDVNVEELTQELKSRQSKKELPEFPGTGSPNPERREKKTKQRAEEASTKEYEKRELSTRTSSSRRDKDRYLRRMYTNYDKEMVCQICHQEMPFRRPDGKYYFEAVELFDGEFVDTEQAELSAALCPVCAAKYKLYIKNDASESQKLFQQLGSKQTPVNLGLSEDNSMRFVEKHIGDIAAIMDTLEDPLSSDQFSRHVPGNEKNKSRAKRQQTSSSSETVPSEAAWKHGESSVDSGTIKSKLTENHTGKRIVGYEFEGDHHEVGSWREFLLNVCLRFYRAGREDFHDKIMAMKGRKRPYFSRSSEHMIAPREIGDTGIYAETNLNANSICKRVKRILESYGYSESAIVLRCETKK